MLAPHEQRSAALENSVDQLIEPGQLALAAEDRILTGAVCSEGRR
jgi:hypothetical protein